MRIAKYKMIPITKLIKIVEKSFSIREVLLKVGYGSNGGNSRILKLFLKEKRISTNHFRSKKPNHPSLIKYMFIENSPTARSTIKKIYFQKFVIRKQMFRMQYQTILEK